uniref:Uncharacterized protein n=1 Tax=Arundo donax TaxID=35708 RepID=A0A0A9E1N5_ARUDO
MGNCNLGVTLICDVHNESVLEVTGHVQSISIIHQMKHKLFLFSLWITST